MMQNYTTMAVSNVDELSLAMQRFGAVDYVVFVLMLLLCAAVGIYFGYFSGKVTTDDYLIGGRSMKTFPIGMSLIASFISGITLLGTPTEIYLYGTQYVYLGFGVVIMGMFMCVAVLPVLHELQLTSIYQYLEMRFGTPARLFGSVLFVISMIIWIPIVVYVPALAFNQVTGINVHIITPIVCVVCIFYTCVGGLKAVVWTDVIQTIIMFGAMILATVKGTMDIGGFSVVWERNWDSGRLEAPNMSVDPFERHTFLILMVGGSIFVLFTGGVMQTMMQRYLALPTLRDAQVAVWIFVGGFFVIVSICSYSGLLIYATFHDCDPLQTKLARAKDQLLPLLVMRTFQGLQGLTGCFVAGVFSAALSSMSTAMNSMSAVVLEDFYKTFRSKPLTERETNIIMKSVTVVTGVICVALVFVVEKMGSVLQMGMSLGSITYAPTLGVFLIGMFVPWVNTKGMLAGGVAALGFMAWIIVGAQIAMATGNIKFDTKPLTIEGCTYSFSALNATSTDADSQSDSEVFLLYRLSYLWYMTLGCLIVAAVSIPVSFMTGATDPSTLDQRLMCPLIRWFLPKQKISTPPADKLLAKGYTSVKLEIIPKSNNDDYVCDSKP